MKVNEEECLAAGLDPRKIADIASRLEKAAMDARKLGLIVFGGSNSGDLRVQLKGETFEDGLVIVAQMAGPWDGGDGAKMTGKDGLLRGE